MKSASTILRNLLISTLFISVSAHSGEINKKNNDDILLKYNKASEELLRQETPETTVNKPNNQTPIQYKSEIVEMDNVDILMLYHMISGDKKYNIRSIASAGRAGMDIIPTPFSKVCDALLRAWQENDEFAINDNTAVMKKFLAEKVRRLQDAFYFSTTFRSTSKSLTYNFNDKSFHSSASFNGEINTTENAEITPARCIAYTDDQKICVHAINFDEAKIFPVEMNLARNIHEIQKNGKLSTRYIYKIERKVKTFRPGINEVEHTTIKAKVVRIDLLNNEDGSTLFSYKIPTKKPSVPD